jgi:dTDP-4-amino-4,6-dideoxygalactose transaminase
MSNICAGIGRGQMKVLGDRVEKKQAINRRYRERLSPLPLTLQPACENAVSNCWLTSLILDDGCAVTPMELVEALTENDIESRPLWKPMHKQPVFAGTAYVTAGDKSVSDELFRRGLCLPSDTKMTMDDVDRVSNVIRSMF